MLVPPIANGDIVYNKNNAMTRGRTKYTITRNSKKSLRPIGTIETYERITVHYKRSGDYHTISLTIYMTFQQSTDS